MAHATLVYAVDCRALVEAVVVAAVVVVVPSVAVVVPLVALVAVVAPCGGCGCGVSHRSSGGGGCGYRWLLPNTSPPLLPPFLVVNGCLTLWHTPELPNFTFSSSL